MNEDSLPTISVARKAGCPSACYSSTIDSSAVPPTPKEFHDRFVQKRLPAIFRNHATTILENPNLFDHLDLANILKVSRTVDHSDDMVEVNVVTKREDQGPSFSPLKGSRVIPVSFATFCESLTSKDRQSRHYMTTQTLPVDDEGRPAVCSWLPHALIHNEILPLRPKLTGNLVPMSSAGLWIGRSNDGITSSGLHHDMHDNLYCVIAGRKTFRIAPPESVNKMQMVGTVHTRHDNGRIVYEEECGELIKDDLECPIRPDGALKSVERIMELELRRDEIEELLEGTSDSAQREELDNELGDIDDELLDHEMEKDDILQDDEESDEESSAGQEEPSKKKSKRPTTLGIPDKESANLRENIKRYLPPNFVVDGHDKVSFEHIELGAGDVLYLPAGWFHEVSSEGKTGKDADGVHIAVNYWFHPPDTAASFDQPYESKFWHRDWSARNKQ